VAERAAEASSRFLTEDERIVIADRLRAKASIQAIAAELGRPASTISREITRNAHPGSGDYRPHAAQARAEARRPRPKGGKISACPELRERVQGWLELEWSPEQISRSLRIAGQWLMWKPGHPLRRRPRQAKQTRPQGRRSFFQ
jgi:IS30 family transposase